MINAFSALTRSALLAGFVFVTGCIRTEPYVDSEGQALPGSIATMETLPIGGVGQSVWFRGIDVENPALILLHGGPGASEAPLFRYFNSELERHFLVVYWEQRGAGRSFDANIPAASMTIERMVEDLDELTETVRRRFGKNKVVLLGHSWGTVLGTLYAHRFPEKVAAYVGVAQVSDMAGGAELSYRFALRRALEQGDAGDVAKLSNLGNRPPSLDRRLTLEKWVERYGGVFHGRLSTGKLIWAALRTDEANLIDLIQFGRGNRFSLTRLDGELAGLNLSERYRAFEVPVFFLLGRYDWHVPAVLAAQYFAELEAPFKRLVWFEQSAHNPPFEQPSVFNRILIEEVRPWGVAAQERSKQRAPGSVEEAQ